MCKGDQWAGLPATHMKTDSPKDEALRMAKEALALLELSGVWLILRPDERRSIREALAEIKKAEVE